MAAVKLAQEELARLIKVSMITSPVDLGVFTVRVLEDVLPKVAGELGLSFDYLEIHPGPQPRESADIELYYAGRIMTKISVKTAVTGELRNALKKLRQSLQPGEDGLIVLFAVAVKGEEGEAKMLLIYMPWEVFERYGDGEILVEVERKIKEKAEREGLENLKPLALNEAILFDTAYKVILASEAAQDSLKAAQEALNAVGKLERRMEERFSRVEERIARVKGRVGELEERITGIERRITDMEKKIGELGEKLDGIKGLLELLLKELKEHR